MSSTSAWGNGNSGRYTFDCFAADNLTHKAKTKQQLHINIHKTHLVYHCLHGLAPVYLSNYFERVADTNRRRLRSSSSSLLAVRQTRLSTVGDRAFPAIGSRFWNTLPDSVTSASSLSVFRSRLKSHLFERSFPADSYWHLPPVLTPDSRTVV